LTHLPVHLARGHLAPGIQSLLVVFGDNVEDELGALGMILLLAGASLAGTFLHGMLDPRGDVPCVGASAGISAVLAYYAIAFPKARLGVFVRFGWYFKWVTFTAAGGMLLWIFFQLLIAIGQLAGAGSVSALAHIGGALSGAALAWSRR
jgi:membrane associated rhomboid family serine protease